MTGVALITGGQQGIGLGIALALRARDFGGRLSTLQHLHTFAHRTEIKTRGCFNLRRSFANPHLQAVINFHSTLQLPFSHLQLALKT